MFIGHKLYANPLTLVHSRTDSLLDTTHPKHATEISKNMTLEYDGLVSVSGDGLIHEVINGFVQHPQSAEAFRIPIAPIPTGSGNGTSLNLLGVEVGLGLTLQMNLCEMRLT